MTKFEEELKKVANAGIDINRKEKTYYERDILRLSEGWVSPEEHRDRVNELIEAKEKYTKLLYENSSLKSQLQQQSLPVVPEYVGEFIESYKDRRTIYGVFDKISKNRKIYPKLYEWVFEDENSQATFALAFITGKYEVEKPQLFYIELPKVFGLSDSIFVSKAESGIISEFTKGKDYALKFTEQEIKSIDKRYWQFAVPVEDGA